MEKTHTWQTALMNAVTDPKELLELLALDPNLLPAAEAAAKLFPLKVPRGFLQQIEKGNRLDPLLRQVLPLEEELQNLKGYSADPLQEKQFNPIPGLLHKYYGRVLLTLVGSCAINCRFCFRRHFPYEENNPGRQGWLQAVNYIAADPTIVEVILSGGDPLVASDSILQSLIEKLEAIPHVKRLRIHTRLPIVLPERVTQELLDCLQKTSLKAVLVTHCNHPNELSDNVLNAIKQLKQAGMVLLNQSVLLKGVNDDAETLMMLSEALFAAGIQPYYLHLLDKVQGTAHFDLIKTAASALHWQITQRLPGYLVPKLVCEQPHEGAKTPVFSRDFCTG